MVTVVQERAAASGYRRIAALALPALVVLAAEPLYVLVDTAVVGHLGRVPLAALGLAGTVLGLAVWLGNVLAYGTTGRAARRFGAGDRAGAVGEGVQASWLAGLAGLALVAAAQLFAGPLTSALSGNGPESAQVAAQAALWLRVASLGAPFILLAMAGNGWMRGVQDTRRPLYYVLGANLASAVLCPLLVYGLGWGMVGSAWANVAAQAASGALFLRALVRERVPLAPQWACCAASCPSTARCSCGAPRSRPASCRRRRWRPASARRRWRRTRSRCSCGSSAPWCSTRWR